MSSHVFKSIYFPREKVRAGKATRISISLPTSDPTNGANPEFQNFIKSISSKQIRNILGNPFIEDIEIQAKEERRSVSNIFYNILHKYYNENFHGKSAISPKQLALFDDILSTDKEPKADLGLTFRENFRQKVYGWYPYVEGFSASYVRDALLRFGKLPKTVYDPFAGVGTSLVASTNLGVSSFFSEINPFMTFVTETKVLSANWAKNNYINFKKIADRFLHQITEQVLDNHSENIDLDSYEKAFPNRDFFEEKHIRHLLAAKEIAISLTHGTPHAQNLLLLACASNAVNSSNMTRRADLRRRRPDEYKNRIVNVGKYIQDTLLSMIEDIKELPVEIGKLKKVSNDCKNIPSKYLHAFDFIITSPPYLNGTNYFRNTKIELWLLDFIRNETELPIFRRKAITAGINNVFKDSTCKTRFKFVENKVAELKEVAKDQRIPRLVRNYFSDMHEMFEGCYRSLVPGGKFLLDIGDSKFYGVHVPTDQFLSRVAEEVGFNVSNRHIIARRHSRDKTKLVQVELVLEKLTTTKNYQKIETSNNNLSYKIKRFGKNLPYKHDPYKKRSWGHSYHSLCSYQGKLKPAIAHWLIKEFVPVGGKILDPLGGVATIPLEGALQGFYSVSNDKSPFAALIGSAKLNPPTIDEAELAIEKLSNLIENETLSQQDLVSAEFGLNGKVNEYYHTKTLEEVLKARKIFLNTATKDRAENFLWAVLLHILHGNRPYALSRTSHPITPLHPKGPFEYKCVVSKIWERAKRLLDIDLPHEFLPGVGLNYDFKELPNRLANDFDVVITSPPFLGMRFDRPNWLRLWFCGWGEQDFRLKSMDFLERQQVKSTNCYKEFFSVIDKLLKPQGTLIVHIGSGGKGNLLGDLRELATSSFCLIGEVDENVQSIENHGMGDKGRTTTHHFMFFKKK